MATLTIASMVTGQGDLNPISGQLMMPGISRLSIAVPQNLYENDLISTKRQSEKTDKSEHAIKGINWFFGQLKSATSPLNDCHQSSRPAQGCLGMVSKRDGKLIARTSTVASAVSI